MLLVRVASVRFFCFSFSAVVLHLLSSGLLLSNAAADSLCTRSQAAVEPDEKGTRTLNFTFNLKHNIERKHAIHARRNVQYFLVTLGFASASHSARYYSGYLENIQGRRTKVAAIRRPVYMGTLRKYK